jgi:NTE family protein
MIAKKKYPHHPKKHMVRNLVIGSGGVMIVALLGALEALHDAGVLQDTHCYHCVSAGSVLSLMLALGYSVEEIRGFLMSFDFKKMVADVDVANIIDGYGLSVGSNMEVVARSIVAYKMGEDSTDLTFHELWESRRVDINIYATCVDDMTLVCFDRTRTPEVPVWKAMVASCRIPYVYAPFEIDGRRYLDGALINPYPIQFASDTNDTIGIFNDTGISASIPVLADLPNVQFFVNVLLNCIHKKYTLYHPYHSVTVRVEVPKELRASPFSFDMSLDTKQRLLTAGQEAVRAFLKEKAHEQKHRRRHSWG